MVFFVSQLIRYARVCSQYEEFLFRGYILVRKLLKQTYSSQKLFFENYMVVIQSLFTNFTLLCHTCWKVWFVHQLYVTHDYFPVILDKSWRVPHVGQEILTLSGTPDFTHSPYIHYWICQSQDYIYWLMTLVCLLGCLFCLGLILLCAYTYKMYMYTYPHYTARGCMSDKDMSWTCCDPPWLYNCVWIHYENPKWRKISNQPFIKHWIIIMYNINNINTMHIQFYVPIITSTLTWQYICVFLHSQYMIPSKICSLCFCLIFGFRSKHPLGCI